MVALAGKRRTSEIPGSIKGLTNRFGARHTRIRAFWSLLGCVLLACCGSTAMGRGALVEQPSRFARRTGNLHGEFSTEQRTAAATRRDTWYPRARHVASGMCSMNDDAYNAVLELRARATAKRTVEPRHFLFPACEHGEIDPRRPQRTWRTSWRRMTRAIFCNECPRCNL